MARSMRLVGILCVLCIARPVLGSARGLLSDDGWKWPNGAKNPSGKGAFSTDFEFNIADDSGTGTTIGQTSVREFDTISGGDRAATETLMKNGAWTSGTANNVDQWNGLVGKTIAGKDNDAETLAKLFNIAKVSGTDNWVSQKLDGKLKNTQADSVLNALNFAKVQGTSNKAEQFGLFDITATEGKGADVWSKVGIKNAAVLTDDEIGTKVQQLGNVKQEVLGGDWGKSKAIDLVFNDHDGLEGGVNNNVQQIGLIDSKTVSADKGFANSYNRAQNFGNTWGATGTDILQANALKTVATAAKGADAASSVFAKNVANDDWGTGNLFSQQNQVDVQAVASKGKADSFINSANIANSWGAVGSTISQNNVNKGRVISG